MNLIYFYRVMRWFYLKKIPLLPTIMQGVIFLAYNSKVPPSVKIGKSTFFVSKGIGVNLLEGTTIGKNCRIGPRFTTARKAPYKNIPSIGNNVWLGINAVVVGPVLIGDNVIIAPNSFVNKSVPEGAIIGGNPARIIGWTKDLEYDIFENPKWKEGYASVLIEKND